MDDASPLSVSSKSSTRDLLHYLLNSASRDHPHGQFCNRLHEMCGRSTRCNHEQDRPCFTVAAVYFLGLRATALALRGPPTIHNFGRSPALIDRRYTKTRLESKDYSVIGLTVMTRSSIGSTRSLTTPSTVTAVFTGT